MRIYKRLSFIILGLICLFISLYRINHVSEKEISWDVLGYYLYLPSTFIYHDALLTDTGWLEKINKEKDLTGTLYMVSTNDEGKPIYFFLMGMALFYLPFFFAGHISAIVLGFPPDGFSLPYQYAMVIGAIIYTIIGLIFLRKILRYFFSEGITSLVMIILVFGTNYIHHLTLKDLETGNVLFMLVSIIIWFTIKWHQTPKLKYLITIGCSITLAGLVKPSEIFVALIPLLWNVYSTLSFREKLKLFKQHKKDLFITLSICFLMIVPQLTYWLIRTGHLFYDSYKNPGVGLDFLSPHIWNVLFSFRKGWLLYTPVMIFALIGFYFLFKQRKPIFLALISYFLVSFYIISCWTEWWYGSSFSNRPLISTYPVLAICLGYFFLVLQKKNLLVKSLFGSVILLLILFNQFQWWQLKNNILEPYRTTKAYYQATFLKTSVTETDKELLLINRSFTGPTVFTNKGNYTPSVILNDTALKSKYLSNIHIDATGNYFYHLSPNEEFFPILEKRFNELTSQDHIWLIASLEIRSPMILKENLPFLVMTMEHNKGVYGYLAPEIKLDSTKSDWKKYELTYLTPEIRNTNDRFKCYLWNSSKINMDFKNLKIVRFEKK